MPFGLTHDSLSLSWYDMLCCYLINPGVDCLNYAWLIVNKLQVRPRLSYNELESPLSVVYRKASAEVLVGHWLSNNQVSPHLRITYDKTSHSFRANFWTTFVWDFRNPQLFGCLGGSCQLPNKITICKQRDCCIFIQYLETDTNEIEQLLPLHFRRNC
jgi:hypothetical protein